MATGLLGSVGWLLGSLGPSGANSHRGPPTGRPTTTHASLPAIGLVQGSPDSSGGYRAPWVRRMGTGLLGPPGKPATGFAPPSDAYYWEWYHHPTKIQPSAARRTGTGLVGLGRPTHPPGTGFGLFNRPGAANITKV